MATTKREKIENKGERHLVTSMFRLSNNTKMGQVNSSSLADADATDVCKPSRRSP